MLYDKNRRPILEGDVLKVFHFTGARNKKYYMYKQAGKLSLLGKEKTPYLQINHLSPSADKFYHQKDNGEVLQHYEIVQGWPDFEDREKLVIEHEGGGK